MGTYFTGTLCAVGLFLFVYKGYTDKEDFWLNVAGVMAFGVAFFPMVVNPDKTGCQTLLVRCPTMPSWSNIFHYGCAISLFSLFAYIDLFWFVKTTHKQVTSRKKTRNTIYYVCGGGIIVSIVIMIAFVAYTTLTGNGNRLPVIFWCEWLCLWFFGTAWLIKGEAVLKDKKGPHHGDIIIKGDSRKSA